MIERESIDRKLSWIQFQLVVFTSLISAIASTTSYSSGLGWFTLNESMPGPLLEFTHVFTIAPFATLLAALVAGYLFDRRRLIVATVIGLILFVAGFAAGSFADTKPIYSVAIIINAMGYGVLLMTPFLAFCSFVDRDYFGRAYLLFIFLPMFSSFIIFDIFEKTFSESSLDTKAAYVSGFTLIVLGTLIGLLGRLLRQIDHHPVSSSSDQRSPKNHREIWLVLTGLLIFSAVLGGGEKLARSSLLEEMIIAQDLGMKTKGVMDLVVQTGLWVGYIVGAIAADFVRRISALLTVALAMAGIALGLVCVIQLSWYWLLLSAFAIFGLVAGAALIPLLKSFAIWAPAQYFGILIAVFFYSDKFGGGLAIFVGASLRMQGLGTNIGFVFMALVLIAAWVVWSLGPRLSVNVEKLK